MKKRYIGIIALGLSLSSPAAESHPYREVGVASYYDDAFDGCVTANGETFSQFQMTCAHQWLPLGTIVKVTNLKNHKSVILRVNDRGPYIDGRMVDLSKSAAEMLGFTEAGLANVRLETISGKAYLALLSEDFYAGIKMGFGRDNRLPIGNVAVKNYTLFTPDTITQTDLSGLTLNKINLHSCRIQTRDRLSYLVFIGIFYRPEKTSAFHDEEKPAMPDAEPLHFFEGHGALTWIAP